MCTLDVLYLKRDLCRMPFIEGGVWYVLEDFNLVCSSTERISANGLHHKHMMFDCLEFSNFFSRMDLIDVCFLGRHFTLFQPNRRDASRLHMIMVSDVNA